MRKTGLLGASAAMVLGALFAFAQSPAPVVVPPAPDSVPAASAPPAHPSSTESDLNEEIELLQELKAKNEDALRKQQASLEVLDQLQKDADQIRIFTKRS